MGKGKGCELSSQEDSNDMALNSLREFEETSREIDENFSRMRHDMEVMQNKLMDMEKNSLFNSSNILGPNEDLMGDLKTTVENEFKSIEPSSCFKNLSDLSKQNSLKLHHNQDGNEESTSPNSNVDCKYVSNVYRSSSKSNLDGKVETDRFYKETRGAISPGKPPMEESFAQYSSNRDHVKKMGIARFLDEKGRKIVREKSDNDNEESHEYLHNMTTEECDDFDKLWNESKKTLPSIEHRTNKNSEKKLGYFE